MSLLLPPCMTGSPAQQELPQKEPRYSILRAAPRSGSSLRTNLLLLPSYGKPRAAGDPPIVEPPPSLYRAAPRIAGAPPERISSLLLPSSPAQREAPPERASSFPLTGSPAQREIPKNEPAPSLYRAAPRSGSSLRKSLLLSSYGKPRAAGDPSNSRASSALPLSSSPAQRELPHTERASSLLLPSSPAQRELPQKWPPPSSLY